MSAPAAAPLITLTTDYGLQDPYVGILKARLVQRAPGIALIDLTHDIRRFHPEEAGYWLYCCYPQLPPGTVHVAVVDPGVGSARGILVLSAAGQLFVAPDNGLLGLIAQRVPGARAWSVAAGALTALGLSAESATFHGRDIMAPLAAELAMRRVRADDLGEPCSPLAGPLTPPRQLPDGSLEGCVAVIDHFGNVLTTIAARELQGRGQVRLVAGAAPLPWVRTYEEAPPGQCVALVNSAGMLELAARQASAAAALNIAPGQPVYVSER
ncbi:MAG TPA: SAM-dependent chlorinase/fluorinase [Steroidobacteraceae bacterium]|nr:SAM-dependent chlorinase/fluorinase [Steroidobacteraceae bacterium]